MTEIENIIFDFGGVLYDIDVQLSIDAFKKIGIVNKPWQDGQDKIFDLIEKGLMNNKEIIEYFRSDNNLTDSEILKAFNAILIGVNKKSYKNLLKLKKNYSLFLLSNTNEIHFDKFSKEIIEDKNTKEFYNCFTKEYYSYKLKMRKPDKEIFQYLINDSKIEAKKSLFIDDTFSNLENAKKLGLKTFWMNNNNSWNSLIEEFGLKI
ncbi:MAG: HAD-IA family hydrolase [Bacteroidota bacterium]|nr:HAD-IA family hydrolase [Bacteroidota bacterium]